MNGMMARDEILQRLRHLGHEAQQPPPWTSRRVFTDLAAQFEQALTAVHGEVRRAPSLEAAIATLDGLLAELGAGPVVVNGEAPFDELDVQERLPQYEWLALGAMARRAVDAAELRTFCATAVAGVSGADAALAETGSVAISCGPEASRLATLLPPVHIALVPESRLTEDIFTWTAARQGTQAANVTLVSGPSKTADIEQTMAIGVHGPKRFVVILYAE